MTFYEWSLRFESEHPVLFAVSILGMCQALITLAESLGKIGRRG